MAAVVATISPDRLGEIVLSYWEAGKVLGTLLLQKHAISYAAFDNSLANLDKAWRKGSCVNIDNQADVASKQLGLEVIEVALTVVRANIPLELRPLVRPRPLETHQPTVHTALMSLWDRLVDVAPSQPRKAGSACEWHNRTASVGTGTVQVTKCSGPSVDGSGYHHFFDAHDLATLFGRPEWFTK